MVSWIDRGKFVIKSNKIRFPHLLTTSRRAGLLLPEAPLSVSFFLSGLLKSFLMAEATLLSFARADMFNVGRVLGVLLVGPMERR